MNSAMPIASGVARTRARAAAQSVPNASGATYCQKSSSPRMTVSPGRASTPGMPCTMRKIATAASRIRIVAPAARAVVEKTRSPGRCLARTGGVAVAMVRGRSPVGM
jgi:hypothetical protein